MTVRTFWWFGVFGFQSIYCVQAAFTSSAVNRAFVLGRSTRAMRFALRTMTDADVQAVAALHVATFNETHTVNNDQRRIPLTFSSSGTNAYDVQVPSNTGIALPGMTVSASTTTRASAARAAAAVAPSTASSRPAARRFTVPSVSGECTKANAVHRHVRWDEAMRVMTENSSGSCPQNLITAVRDS